MKHAQKVTKAISKTRPVLGGVIHRDNYLAVTDSHRLYFASDAYEGLEKNVDPKTGAELTDGNYPDITRLIPESYDAKFSVNINVDRATQAVKLIESAGKVGKASDLIVFKRDIADLVFSTCDKSLVECRYIAGDNLDGDPFVMTASAKYVAEALALMKDAGFTEVTFNFFGVHRPFTFTGGNLTALILPVRTI